MPLPLSFFFPPPQFFAIGLFRLLELTGAKEPAALERLVKSVNVRPESVNKDLMLYKVGTSCCTRCMHQCVRGDGVGTLALWRCALCGEVGEAG